MSEKTIPTHHGTDGKTPAESAHSLHGSRSPSKQIGLAVSPGKLQEALLFRWKLALAVGLVLASLGIGIAWLTYKPKYTAVASMRMSASKQTLLPGAHAEDERNVEKFQRTEAQLVKSREVLRTALNKDQIRGLTTIRLQEDPLAWLEKDLQASFVGGTDIFRLWLTGDNPDDLALIVNAVRDVYVNQFVNAAKKQQAERFESIVNVMVESEEKIRKQREVLRELAAGLKTGDTQVLTLKQKLALEEFFERKRELSTLEAEMRRNVALQVVQVAELKAIETAEPSKLPPAMVEDYVEKHPKVQKAQLDIARLEAQIKEYRKFTSSGPRLSGWEEELKDTRAQLQKTKKDILPMLAKSVQDLVRRQRADNLEQTQEKLKVGDQQRAALAEMVAHLGKEAEKIGLGSFEIETRRTEIELAETVLKTLRAEKERLEIEKFNNRETILAKQDAEVPTINQASLPKAFGMYGIGGLLLGFLGVSYLEARLHRVHKAAQVDQELGIQTLGILPLLAQKGSRAYGEAAVATDSIPDIMFNDAVNSLCARLLCDDRLPKNAVIMVTSATEDEGKTMLATHLATGLARSGHRTLLLDCDFRNSRCHDRFGLPAGPGLSEVLMGEADLANVVQAVPDSEARIMTAGKGNPQVIKALTNGKFAALLTRLRQDFDHIIIDSAPTPVVSDGLLIGKLANGVIVVVRPKVSKAPAVIAAYEQLAALRIPILGAVVNANAARATGAYYKKS